MPRLRHLRYFVAVAEEGQITAAAQKLHLAQPALSEAIAQLEEALRLKPDYVEAHNNPRNALVCAGAHNNLGNALLSAGRTSDAIAQFEEALRLKPDLGGGNLPEAIAELKAALLLQEEQRRSGSSGVAHAPGAAEATPK